MYNLILYLIFLVYFPLIAMGQPVLQRFKIPIEVKDAGVGKGIIWFGVNPDASYCRDTIQLVFNDGSIVREEEKPPPPPGLFDVRFVGHRTGTGGCSIINEVGLGLDYNIHNIQPIDTFLISITYAEGFTRVFLSWPAGLNFYYDSVRMRSIGLNVNMVDSQRAEYSNIATPQIRIFAYGPKVPPAPPSSGPSLISPPNNAVDQPFTITFNWSSVPTAVSYIIQVSSDSNFTSVEYSDTLVGTSKQITNLRGDTKYFWRVRALNPILEVSPWSSVRNFTTLLPEPNAPSLISPTNGESNVSPTATFRWYKSDYSVSYRLQLSKSSNFSPLVKDTVVSDTLVQIGNLDNCVSYYWRVRGINRVNVGGAYSEVYNFKVEMAIPSSPLLIFPAHGDSNIDTRATLRWFKEKCSNSYRLKVSLDETFTSLVKDTVTSDTSYRFYEQLQPSTIYYWQVCGLNNLGIGDSSVRMFKTTAIMEPAVPSLLSPPDNAIDVDISPILIWRSVYQGEKYHLQISENVGFNPLVFNDSTTDTTLQVGRLLSNKKYYWRVRAINSAGYSNFQPTPWSFTTKVVVPDAPILEEPSDNAQDVSVNPVLIWRNTYGAVRYHLEVATDAQFVGRVFIDSTIEINLRQVRGLADYTKYYWRVRAWNSAGWGDFSPVWQFRTMRTQPGKWFMPLAIRETGAAVDTIYFGVDPDATSGIDPWLGEYELPPVDYTFFDARFIGPPNNPNILGNGTRINILKFRNYSQIDTYRVRFHPGYFTGSYPIILSWPRDFVQRVCDSMLLIDEANGVYVKTRMDLNSSSTVTYSSITSLLIIKWGALPILPGVELPVKELPKGFALLQNYPNPFNPSTRIEFHSERSARIRISIFDMLGKEIKNLVDANYQPGRYYVDWHGVNESGVLMPSGVYCVRMVAVPNQISEDVSQSFISSRLMIMIK